MRLSTMRKGKKLSSKQYTTEIRLRMIKRRTPYFVEEIDLRAYSSEILE